MKKEVQEEEKQEVVKETLMSVDAYLATRQESPSLKAMFAYYHRSRMPAERQEASASSFESAFELFKKTPATEL